MLLHPPGWVHRDIKPVNLGVVSIDPPKAVILDLGQIYRTDSIDSSQAEILPRPGQIGTVMYLAPEMEHKPYNDRVDIFALGIVSHELIYGFHPWRTSVNPWPRDKTSLTHPTLPKFHVTMKKLGACAAESFENLILCMLWWDPDQRISASEALQHSAIVMINTDVTDSEEGPITGKRRRE